MATKAKKKIQKKAAKKPAARTAKQAKVCKAAIKKIATRPKLVHVGTQTGRFKGGDPGMLKMPQIKVVESPKDKATIAALESKINTLQTAVAAHETIKEYHSGLLGRIGVALMGKDAPAGAQIVLEELPGAISDAVAVSNQMGKLAEDLDSVLRPLEGEGLLAAAKRLSNNVVDTLAKAANFMAATEKGGTKAERLAKQKKETGMRVPKDIAEIMEVIGEADIWASVRGVLGLDQPETEEFVEETKAEVVAVNAAPKPVKTGRRGRPKGSKNKPKSEATLVREGMDKAGSMVNDALSNLGTMAAETNEEEEGVEIG